MLPDNIPLKVPKEVAEQKIKNQIEKGNSIRELVLETQTHYEQAKQTNDRWVKSNTDMLSSLFNEPSIANQFPAFHWPSDQEKAELYIVLNNFRESIKQGVRYLQTILEKLHSQ